MSSLTARTLESFPAWLRSLADDARALTLVLEERDAEATRGWVASALTYLFKSVDLIPDGLEDLGYIDDAFVLRAAAAKIPADERALDASGTLERLAADVELIAEFLGPETFEKLESYVARLSTSAARGRSVPQVLEDPDARAALAADIREWAESYAEPTFLRDEKNLVKLRAFLTTRLNAT